MPAPTMAEEFLDVVRKSGAVDEKRLAAALMRGSLPSEPTELAGQLVFEGVLTRFQAEQFLQGKWRGFTIGKYKVLERLRTRASGAVYLCEHAAIQRRRVAIKVLPAAMASDPAALERFYREARAVAALRHPNFIRVYDVDQEENLHFLVMEHVDGSSLKQIVKRTGPMDVLRAGHYVCQAALALLYAHEAVALVHAHVKPSNVMVDRTGVVKIIDLSRARFLPEEDTVTTRSEFSASVIGTPDYLAPEQALVGRSVDFRADTYSLGCTFYFCLTGHPPFPEGTVEQKLLWHQTRQPTPIRDLRPEVPEEVVALVERMMAKDVNARFQTMQEVADALAPHTQTPILPPPEHEMPQYCPALIDLMKAPGGSNQGTQMK